MYLVYKYCFAYVNTQKVMYGLKQAAHIDFDCIVKISIPITTILYIITL